MDLFAFAFAVFSTMVSVSFMAYSLGFTQGQASVETQQ